LLGTSTDPVEPELSPEELEYRDKLLAANSALKKPAQQCPAHWSEARKAATIARNGGVSVLESQLGSMMMSSRPSVLRSVGGDVKMAAMLEWAKEEKVLEKATPEEACKSFNAAWEQAEAEMEVDVIDRDDAVLVEVNGVLELRSGDHQEHDTTARNPGAIKGRSGGRGADGAPGKDSGAALRSAADNNSSGPQGGRAPLTPEEDRARQRAIELYQDDPAERTTHSLAAYRKGRECACRRWDNRCPKAKCIGTEKGELRWDRSEFCRCRTDTCGGRRCIGMNRPAFTSTMHCYECLDFQPNCGRMDCLGWVDKPRPPQHAAEWVFRGSGKGFRGNGWVWVGPDAPAEEPALPTQALHWMQRQMRRVSYTWRTNVV